MTKEDLILRLSESNYQYDNKKLLGWVRALPNYKKSDPNVLKIGDVFMHPIFNHPYVLLQCNKGVWVCTLLTSNGELTEVLCKCESRFFYDSYISKVLFTITEPFGSFMGVYENNVQLREIKNELKQIFK